MGADINKNINYTLYNNNFNYSNIEAKSENLYDKYVYTSVKYTANKEYKQITSIEEKLHLRKENTIIDNNKEILNINKDFTNNQCNNKLNNLANFINTASNNIKESNYTIDNINSSNFNQKAFILGAFDGNNGVEISKYIKENLVFFLMNNLSLHKNQYEKALLETILDIDSSLIKQEGLSKIYLITRESYEYYKEYDSIKTTEDCLNKDLKNLINKIDYNSNEIKDLLHNLNNDTKSNVDFNLNDIQNLNKICTYLNPRCNDEFQYDMIPILSGSTLLIAIIDFNCIDDNSNNYIYIANVGNCRALIKPKYVPIKQLTIDHVPIELNEYTRIFKADGIVKNNKIDNSIKSSRSLGNFKYKLNPNIPKEENIITCIPDIYKLRIQENTEFIILVNSHVTDILTNEQIYNFIYKEMASYSIIKYNKNDNLIDKDIVNNNLNNNKRISEDSVNHSNSNLKNESDVKTINVTINEYVKLLETSVINLLKYLVVDCVKIHNNELINYICIVISNINYY